MDQAFEIYLTMPVVDLREARSILRQDAARKTQRTVSRHNCTRWHSYRPMITRKIVGDAFCALYGDL